MLVLSEAFTRRKHTRCLIIIKIISIGLPTIVFGVFTIVYTLQQDKLAKITREQDQKLANEENIRRTFENYIDDISTLLLGKHFNRSNTEHLLHIRVKTLAILPHIDANRKRDIILFLYESRLLRANMHKTERLSLVGADLSGIRFTGSLTVPFLLNNLYLPGITAPNLVFDSCQLNNAVFDLAYLPNLRIINTAIANSSFRQIYAPDSTLYNVIFHRNNFSGAMIARMHYTINVYLNAAIDFTNADLIDSRLTFDDSEVDLMPHLTELTILNARLPDGSFGDIDSSDLVIDGGAEEGCQSNESVQMWLPNDNLPALELSHVRNHSTMSTLVNIGNCSFLARSLGESSLFHLINVQLFSVLIDSGQAIFNISAYLGCQGRKNANVSIILTFLQDSGIANEQFEVLKTMGIPQMFTDQELIPPKTRQLYVSLHSHITDTTGYCLIDNVKLNIFKKDSRTHQDSAGRVSRLLDALEERK